MTPTPLQSPAKSPLTDVRQLLTANSKIYAGYVHLRQRDQSMLHEYCNVSDGTQQLAALLLDAQGHIPPGSAPKLFTLQPQDILSLETGRWVREAGLETFVGQLIIIVDQVTSGGAPPVYPAITAQWISPRHHSKVATAAFERVNLPSFQRKKSFYMYCPMTVSDARRTTVIALFNHSTDPSYADSAEVQMTLHGKAGEELAGRPLSVLPFGALIMDVGEHFGTDGAAFFSAHQGYVALSMRHLGHTLPAYFFHVDRQTLDILSGQHAQPPIAALTHFGIWWGKLRRFGF